MKAIVGTAFAFGCAWSYFTGDWMEAALLSAFLVCIAVWALLTYKERR